MTLSAIPASSRVTERVSANSRPEIARASSSGTSSSTCSRISDSCRLSEGMFTSSSVRAARRSPRSSMRRTLLAAREATDLRRHNPRVTTRQPDPAPGAAPERGFVLGVFAKGVDGDEELAELRELARTARVEPVGELVQHRERPDPRTFVGKGKLEELKSGYAESE